MLVPVGFLKHSKDQPSLILSKGRGRRDCSSFLEELRQMSPLDDLVLSKDNCMAYGVLQLADIAWPFIVHQGLHGIGGERSYLFPLFQIVFLEEMLAEEGDVLFAIT